MQHSEQSPMPDPFITLPTPEELSTLSETSFGYTLPSHQVAVYHGMVCAALNVCLQAHACSELRRLEVPVAAPLAADLSTASQVCESKPDPGICTSTQPREFTLIPASGPSNPYGAWTVRCRLTQHENVASLPLKGKRVLLKDNIPVRGLPMTCGTSFLFTPHRDSPLVTRCLAAGATVVGIAQCEYMCFSGSSHTAAAGLVRNPLATDYIAGGSSSGCAVLVASGEADLGIGSDQGGSCRIPSALTGIVGLKPSHDLLPYTLMDGMFAPIDHAGLITRTVAENALFLGVLAGSDGPDDREWADYCSDLKSGVEGMRIGLLREGFLRCETDVVEACESVAKLLHQAGAVVEDVSMPLHSTTGGIWELYVLGKFVENLFYSRKSEMLGTDKHGQERNRAEFLRTELLENAASWSVGFRVAMLAGEWLRKKHPGAFQAGEAYRKQLKERYQEMLSKHEVLMMPTVPSKARKLPKHLGKAAEYEAATAEELIENATVSFDLADNTAPFNLTGHPALALPVGRALNHEGVSLPISLMLIGKHFHEATLYRVAYAIESAFPKPS